MILFYKFKYIIIYKYNTFVLCNNFIFTAEFQCTSVETGQTLGVSIFNKYLSFEFRSTSKTAEEEKETDLTRCLWISGLAAGTKAANLKNHCQPHGKVNNYTIYTIMFCLPGGSGLTQLRVAYLV